MNENHATGTMILHGQIAPMPDDLAASETLPEQIAVEVRHFHEGQFAPVLYLVRLTPAIAPGVVVQPAGMHIAVIGTQPVPCSARSHGRPVYHVEARVISLCLQCLTQRHLSFRYYLPGLVGDLMIGAHGGFGDPPQSWSFFPDAPPDAISCPRCGATDVHVVRYHAYSDDGPEGDYDLRGLKLFIDGFIILLDDPRGDSRSDDEVAQCQHCGHEGDLAAFDKYGLNFRSGDPEAECADLPAQV